MTNIMNEKDISTIQFYQMPKVFFQESKYTSMKNESKLAYMLLRDLLPLSIKNNWVNEDGEVFVKLSRSKLMALLNIKGTQKAAQVMKELVDYGLIIYKRIGLTKCNEIYICTPDIPKSNDSHDENQTHIKTKATKTNNNKTKISQSINQEEDKNQDQQERDRQSDDLKAVDNLLENQIYIEDLKEQYDPDFVDEIANNIYDMYLSKQVRISQQTMPQAIVRGVLSKLQMYHIEHVIDSFNKAALNCKIHNPKGYLQTMIYNSIC